MLGEQKRKCNYVQTVKQSLAHIVNSNKYSPIAPKNSNNIKYYKICPHLFLLCLPVQSLKSNSFLNVKGAIDQWATILSTHFVQEVALGSTLCEAERQVCILLY